MRAAGAALHAKQEKAMAFLNDLSLVNVNDLTLLAAEICNAAKCEEPWLPLGALLNRSAHETALAELLKAHGLESLSPADAAKFALTLALYVVKLARRDLVFVPAYSRAPRP